jgi:sugar-specific transcriptional regulator TrmB
MKKAENQLKNSLISLGLSDKESSVYLALLELGRSTVSKISREADVNRATGYVILDSLVNKGLAHISGKEPKQEYTAESPDNLVSLLRNEKTKAEKALVAAEALALELKSIQKKDERPQVKFYEGADGMKQVYEDTLTSKETILAFATIEDVHAAFSNYFPRYYKRRAEKGINIRAVFPDTPLSIERTKYDTEEARESVLVPANIYTFHPEINIYDNKMMIASWREKLGIIIESTEIADAMKKIFELAWIGAKQVERETKI